MKIKQLTKRESQIMNILWNTDEFMSASDIQKVSDDLSIYTIQQVLQRLLKMNFIKVGNISFNKKALTREYTPVVSQAEYVEAFINENTGFELTAKFISKKADLDKLNELEQLIISKKNELEGK